jgi:uncharacterized protein DUF6494
VDEEVFNLELRTFLKRFGVTAQREIEKAVDAALKRGAITGREVVPIRATLTIPGVLTDFQIDGEIALAGHLPAAGNWTSPKQEEASAPPKVL